ncbi:MAG: hypothetical protein H6573_27210 [Lewinellaceae bacterium]|nr:hypothetical protein [Phaeodactylibacter sp.]MCB9351156.1 hypothetical protein [Lewinellaceae bacterium]
MIRTSLPIKTIVFFSLFSFGLISSCSKDDSPATPKDELRLTFARLGSQTILNGNAVDGEGAIYLGFSAPVERASSDMFQISTGGMVLADTEEWNAQGDQATITVNPTWIEGEVYTLRANNRLASPEAADLEELMLTFSITKQPLRATRIQVDTHLFTLNADALNTGISVGHPMEIAFSRPLAISPQSLKEFISIEGRDKVEFNITALSDTTFQLQFTETLKDFTNHQLVIGPGLGAAAGREFDGLELTFFTGPSSTPDFPILSDEELLTTIQEQTFRYFWDFGHPNCGMARERNTSGNTVTSGGSGFGLMAMVVAVERGFITMEEALQRWVQVVGFLETADRFHGAWAHWMNGQTGAVIPFSAADNGGDLVETAFLVQGLLTVRQYLLQEAPQETELIGRINTLWEGVEWDWYTKGQNEALYWHWSPDNAFQINLKISGHNETQIVYILAASSPTHPINPEIYQSGYARSGAMVNGQSYFGITLPLGSAYGGPLFFTHYSYLGLDPRNLEDQYANYWTQNVNHSLINYQYCVQNPKKYYGYSAQSWGLTASDSYIGYTAHSPTNDRGVITPTAAVSSIPYTPEESLAAIRHFYYDLGDRLWGAYGFYDAFHPTNNWEANSFLAIDQGPIICMIENYRTGLLWDVFMTAPEVQQGLNTLGFTY